MRLDEVQDSEYERLQKQHDRFTPEARVERLSGRIFGRMRPKRVYDIERYRMRQGLEGGKETIEPPLTEYQKLRLKAIEERKGELETERGELLERLRGLKADLLSLDRILVDIKQLKKSLRKLKTTFKTRGKNPRKKRAPAKKKTKKK